MDDIGARTRQVLEVLYRMGEASAADIHRALPILPSYSAARSLLRALEGKGLVDHRREGNRYLYSPRVPRREASRAALRRLLDTFFKGSHEGAVKALLEISSAEGEAPDYDELERLIREAREEGR